MKYYRTNRWLTRLNSLCVVALAAILPMVPAGLTGCSEGFYRRQADHDVYRIVSQREQQVTGCPVPESAHDISPAVPFDEQLRQRDWPPTAAPSTQPCPPVVLLVAAHENPQMSILFDAPAAGDPVGRVIDGSPPAALAGEPAATTQPVALGDVEIPPIEGPSSLFVEPGSAGRASQPQARPIDLVTALRLASLTNREYQAGKEAVYRSALALTGQQHEFENQFFGTIDAELAQDEIRARSGAADSGFGFTRNFTTGGAMAVSLTNALFQVFTDPTGRSASSAINMTVSQPLLRGFGYRVAAEPLIQADRNVTYAVRDFERLKRRLAVQVATQFYQVVQQGDQVNNERNNYATLILASRRTAELAKAGRLPGFEVDQARQDELRARNRWLVSVQRYNQSADSFRVLLGLPPDWPIVPDPASLSRLTAEGLKFELPAVDQAVRQALANRLDLRTASDRVEDADRQIYVAADALKMGFDLVASANIPTAPGLNRPVDFTPRSGNYAMGFLIDLPLDRLDERNAYRTALIDLTVAQRNMTEQIDEVTGQVREDIRNVVLARSSYEIQASAVGLAKRRVESTSLLLRAGRASTRDLLDSQAALVEAQNALTAALVDYHVARLQLLRDMEILQVEPAGLTYHDSTTIN